MEINEEISKEKNRKIKISYDKKLTLVLLYCCIVVDVILEFSVFLFKWTISLNEVFLVFLKCSVSLFSIALSTTIALEGLKDVDKNSLLLKKKTIFIIFSIFGYCMCNLLISLRYNDSNEEWYHYLIDGVILLISLVIGMILSVKVLKTYFMYKDEKEKESELVKDDTGYKGDPNVLGDDKAKATVDIVNSFANLEVED